VEVTAAELLACDRERGEPPLSRGFSVIEIEKALTSTRAIQAGNPAACSRFWS
jgi:hypothetical protein